MQSKLKILLVSMLLLIGLSGCVRGVVLHPITNQDFAVIQKGEASPVDGYVMSEFYLKEVLEAKLEVK